MSTQTQNAETSIKRLLNESDRDSLVRRQKGIEARYKQFLATCENNYRCTSAAGALYALLGEDNHQAEGEIHAIKESIRYLLAFLTQAEIASEFEKFRGHRADFFGKHLLQVLECLDRANNPYSMAEMGSYELDLALYSDGDLDNFEKDLEDFKKFAD